MDRLKAVLKRLLLEGLSPDKLAASVVTALLCGTFPVLGSTTILIWSSAFLFKLNLPVMQTMNYFVYPFQLALYIPLMMQGAALLDPAQDKLTLSGVWAMIREDVWGTIRQLFWANLGAILIWAAVAMPVALLLYPVLRKVMRNLHSKYRREPLPTP
jgi:uncharacterized protein (DUF2062 family)